MYLVVRHPLLDLGERHHLRRRICILQNTRGPALSPPPGLPRALSRIAARGASCVEDTPPAECPRCAQAKDAYFGAMGFYWVCTFFTLGILIAFKTPISENYVNALFLITCNVLAVITHAKTHKLSKLYLIKEPEAISIEINELSTTQ